MASSDTSPSKVKRKDAKKDKKKKKRKREKEEEEESSEKPTTQEETLVATDEETPKKKKKKSKKESISDNHDDVDDGDANDVDDHEVEEKKDKSAKKKKKKSKHKEKKDTSGDIDLEDEEEEENQEEKKKKEKSKKHDMIAEQHNAERDELMASMDKDEEQDVKPRSRIVASSAIEYYDEELKQHRIQADKEKKAQEKNNITLLLFYTYVEPVWDDSTYQFMLHKLQEVGKRLDMTGRMRVAREGLNCTLTATHENIVEYCQTLRKLRPKEFAHTEFKLTNHLPLAQKFPNLKVFKVIELVHYGLEGPKAPPIAKFQGTHLEPKDYHRKLGESNTVIIDVRNHYEAAIGRFVPPEVGVDVIEQREAAGKGEAAPEGDEPPPPQWLDPLMRKSTEFPVWLDKQETREQMKGKQVLMYCTGGIRCERASALLRYKIETDPTIKELGIKGVYQLQGGIDKYFKEFPDGGYWQGKNYVFDKRFAHAPPKVDGELYGKVDGTASQSGRDEELDGTKPVAAKDVVMGKCEACLKPWDMYRGKRRCPTCGVPSLICRDCFVADKEGRKKLGRAVRCDLCVEQGIFSKHELREKDKQDIQEYEQKMAQRGLLKPEEGGVKAPNPDQVTRLFLRNMCRNRMDEATLLETIPGITHIVWRIDRKSNKFLGQGWLEMASPDDAARAVARDGKITLFNRLLYIAYQAPDGKDAWPPPNSAVSKLK